MVFIISPDRNCCLKTTEIINTRPDWTLRVRAPQVGSTGDASELDRSFTAPQGWVKGSHMKALDHAGHDRCLRARYEVYVTVTIENVEALTVVPNGPRDWRTCGAVKVISNSFISGYHGVRANGRRVYFAAQVGIAELREFGVREEIWIGTRVDGFSAVSNDTLPTEFFGVVSHLLAWLNKVVLRRRADVRFSAVNVFEVNQCAVNFCDVGGFIWRIKGLHVWKETIVVGVEGHCDADTFEIVGTLLFATLLVKIHPGPKNIP